MTAPSATSANASIEMPLKRQLKRVERARQFKALGLILPLLVFLLFTFAGPIAGMLWRSVEDRDVRQVLPHTIAALAGWDGKNLPDEEAFAALVSDIQAARAAGTLAVAAKRLNYALNGFRTILTSTGRNLKGAPERGTAKETLTRINPAWRERATWTAIRDAGGPVTSFYLLAALDLVRNADGAIVSAPPDQAIYRNVFARTFLISLSVTVLCLILGFPVAYLLATLPPARSNLLMIFVLLPFWTSLLVRTCAWIVLLQSKGVVNDSLHWLGIIDEPLRLIYNRFGVCVAMTHVLLPFMILPLYSSMKAISPAYMRAAASLGAPPVTAFLRIYLPQTLPGIGAGSLLVFILALGYYITPALVGGAADQMISYFIALYTTETANWGLASALGAVLLLATVLLALVYGKLVQGQQVTGGMKN
ncbi:ABC transporter permease [Bradyrhizobium daqingense]|uniref:Putative spermidine/putrescine transport system permease protein n=1 Tax=Bradyrhizobium daqingense TaxID=993502 RepID=A0A562L9A1_9BRAD|nr:ABC transporter permease [Bradyrhizobium daqingense]TWI04247.1 putative spermidine/putrescine transport system permease protein [Bradyrhizobium daqingense]UFS91819.1 ABC transporter permease [Bradyrhizobium daqingense]